MGVVLAALSALVYGVADYAGGKATRLLPSVVVTFLSQAAGFALVLVFCLIVPSGGPTVRNLGFGAMGGLAGGAGLILFYHALSIGTMSVVSPVCAVVAAMVPVAAGHLGGERPGSFALIGIAMALVAIALVGLSGTSGSNRRGLGMAVAAGLGFGLFFVALARCGDRPGLWPLVAARPASMTLAWLLARRARVPITLAGTSPVIIAVAGVLDMIANLLFVIAATRGDLSIIGVVASLYPASTVCLAGWLDHERLRLRQWIGLASAGLALAFVSMP